MKKILRFLTQRVVLTALLILIQALLLFGIIWKLNNYFIYFYAFSVLLSLLLTLRIINNKSNPAFKIAWLIPSCCSRCWADWSTWCSARTEPASTSETRWAESKKRCRTVSARQTNVRGLKKCRRMWSISRTISPTAHTVRLTRTQRWSICRWVRSSLNGWCRS